MESDPRRSPTSTRRSRARHSPPERGATWFEVWRGRLALLLGRLANACGLPGQIRAAQLRDAASGIDLAISVGPLFTTVTVNGRDFYFRRFSGAWDGTGGSGAP